MQRGKFIAMSPHIRNGSQINPRKIISETYNYQERNNKKYRLK
jgi:hypothetical protein